MPVQVNIERGMGMSISIGKTAAALGIMLGLLTGCGSGDSVTGASNPGVTGQGGGDVTASACPEADAECSGGSLLRTDGGIGVTENGVQVYAVSTNDLVTPNPSPSIAVGLLPQTGGLAQIRFKRDADGQALSSLLLLNNFGLSWDGRTERPLIIETFEKRQGRVQLDREGKVVFSALPPFGDLQFYDFALKGAAGTQSNYANNIYFPRTEPVRCPRDAPGCPSVETEGLQSNPGDWRTGGTRPDNYGAARLHEDGATQAGLRLDANGNPTPQDPNGPGVAYPGFKGFRNLHQWSYQYANLASWITQDTVMIDEWGGAQEHNKARRGFVAYGAITPADQIPTTGQATYLGSMHGLWSYSTSLDSYPAYGDVTATVDFAARTVNVTFSGTRIDEATLDPLPLTIATTVAIGTGPWANYFFGQAANEGLAGGLGARFFGPITGTGTASAPAEIAGSFQLQAANAGPVAIGGFLLRKQ
jgi:hypothetical protein